MGNKECDVVVQETTQEFSVIARKMETARCDVLVQVPCVAHFLNVSFEVLKEKKRWLKMRKRRGEDTIYDVP